MFIHIVLWKVRTPDDATSKEEVISQLLPNVQALPALIPQIRELAAGSDVLNTPSSYDFGLLVKFDSREDFLIYRDHPEHVKVGQQISAIAAERASIDFIN